MTALIAGYLLIFFARVVDVSLQTMRVLLLVRGKRPLAAAIGFFEVAIYVLALKYVVDRLNDPLSLVIYAMGFSAGNLVGGMIEEKVALGHLTVQVISMCRPLELAEFLRQEGYGVTVLKGEGREGTHFLLNIILSRKDLPKVMDIVNRWDCQAFVTVLDARATKGGIFTRKGK
ncbi:hypothetical protein SY88_21315 [Clostridiales bacterium PH28_bin88]|nr:hypothetical protein SY88_21315 [Clostridiales bacterium PH28_bin88]